jgi:hypothetical protein
MTIEHETVAPKADIADKTDAEKKSYTQPTLFKAAKLADLAATSDGKASIG